MSGAGASFSQITPLTPRVVGIDYVAVPKPGQYVAPPYCPYLTAQPSPESVANGQPASFSIAADGALLSYQWQASIDAGATWANVANSGLYYGAHTNALGITAATLGMDGYLYRCVTTAEGCDPVNSQSAELSVS